VRENSGANGALSGGENMEPKGGGLVLVAKGGRVGLEGGGSPWCAWSTQAQRVVK
jgi:hypothetical protein